MIIWAVLDWILCMYHIWGVNKGRAWIINAKGAKYILQQCLNRHACINLIYCCHDSRSSIMGSDNTSRIKQHSNSASRHRVNTIGQSTCSAPMVAYSTIIAPVCQFVTDVHVYCVLWVVNSIINHRIINTHIEEDLYLQKISITNELLVK